MYQVSVLAVILFVNGVQIPLSSPAILEDQVTWVPVRAVFQELGWEVKWEARGEAPFLAWKAGWEYTAPTLTLSAPGRLDIVLRVGERLAPGLEGGRLPAAPRRINNTIYVPAPLLRLASGAQLEWDNEQKALYISAPPAGEPGPVKIEQLTNNPPDWVNKKVTVTGEYTGWRPDPFDPATSHGPPVTRSDWTIHDDTGSIYCSARRPREGSSPISLRPYEDLGRRIQVTGVVRLAERGFPYLEPVEITTITGLPGVTCYLSTDRSQYQPGQTVVMNMTVANPFDESVTLQFTSGQTYDFAIWDSNDQKVWQWSDDKVFTMALQQRELAAGDSYQVSTRWTVPEGETKLPPGLYRITGIINQDVWPYGSTIAITASD